MPITQGEGWGGGRKQLSESLHNLLCRFPNILKNPLGASELLLCLKANTEMHEESNYRKATVVSEEPGFQMSFVDSNKMTRKELHEKRGRHPDERCFAYLK